MKRIYTLSRTAFVLICICLFLVITAQAQQEQAAEPAQAQQEQAAEPAQAQQEQAAEPAQAQQETAVLEVESAAICEDIVDREPVGAGDSFSVSMGKLFCFTKIVGAETDVDITHAWYFGDTERARITLTVKSSNWRTYSSKILQAHEVGAWHVDVLDESGNVLDTVDFEVVQ
jgi:hypothetical protein